MEMNNDCICPGTKCLKIDKCRYSEKNYWTWNDNSKWVQVEDWSTQGSCNIHNDSETGKLIVEEEHWCGDLSKIYPMFKECE